MYNTSIRNLLKTVYVEGEPNLTARIEYWGSGWYSLDDDNTYRKGRAATFNRIKVKSVSLHEKIQDNRIREARRDKAQALLNKLRLNFYEYEHTPKQEKSQRLIERCRKLLTPRWEARATGPSNISDLVTMLERT